MNIEFNETIDLSKFEFEKPIPVYHSKDELEPKQIDPRGLRAKLPLYDDFMTKYGLMLMTNEELCERFRKEIIEDKPDPEWERRLKEYYQNIERDFQEEWSKKKFKWFFTKRRQKKLKYKVSLRYTDPVFWLIEEVIEETLPKAWSSDEYFNKFVDFKDIAKGE